MNTKTLIRWSGLAAVVAGVCFVVVELFHPPLLLAAVTTPQWALIYSLAIAMGVFGLLGAAGIQARQAKAAGWLGLTGYLLLSLWLAVSIPFNFIAAFFLPTLATKAPGLAEGFLAMLARSASAM